MRTGKGLIDGQLAELRDQPSPPATLRAMQAPLRANFATLEQIYAVGITKAGYDRRADRLSAVAGRSAGAIEAMLDGAGRDYEHRAVRAQNQAGVGSAAVILLLLLAFGVYYRRAAQARAVAAGLAPRERTAAGREPRGGAHGRPHRAGQPPRAGQRPRDRAAPRRRSAPAHPRALRPRRLQAVQRQLRPSRRRRAARPPGRAAQGGDQRPRQRSTGWAATSSACSPPIAPGGGDDARADWPPRRSATRATPSRSAARTAWRASPAEAATPEEALRLADQRMYAHKADRPTIGREGADLLLQVITERGAGLSDARQRRRPARRRHRRSPRAPRARGQAHPAGRRAPRRRQDGDPRHRPQQAQRALRRGVGVHAPPHGDRRAHHPRRPVAGPRGRARPLQPRALRRGRLPRRPERRGDPHRRQPSSPCATPSTRWSPTGPTARRCRSATPWPSCAAARAPSFTRAWSRPSARW